MKYKSNKSILVRILRDLARIIEHGTYRSRRSRALKISRYVLNSHLPSYLFASSNAEPGKEGVVSAPNNQVNLAVSTDNAPIKQVSVTTFAPKFNTKAARLLAHSLTDCIDEIVEVERTCIIYRVRGGFPIKASNQSTGWYTFMKQLRAHLGIAGCRTVIKRSELMALLPTPLAGKSWIDFM